MIGWLGENEAKCLLSPETTSIYYPRIYEHYVYCGPVNSIHFTFITYAHTVNIDKNLESSYPEIIYI